MATTARVYIVMELVIGGGPLLDKINFSRLPGRTSGMSETKARHYFHQLICAVDCCHRRGVIHRDLKQSNLLLDADGVLRVSDFGMSALPQQARVIRNRGYEGKKADIWSCGAILFHLVAGYVPFRNEYDDRNTKIRQILQADFICPSFFSSSLITLIRRILDPNPTTGDEAGSSAPPVPVMNAFEILNTFLGYNLIIGKLLNQLVQLKRETRFISQNPVDEIIDGIERVAGIMGFDVKKINNFREGQMLDAKVIFLYSLRFVRYIAQPFHMVELRKAEGDVLEFHNFCRHIYAALSDFIWKGRAEPMDTETDG
ncbi:hypothetical protein JHK82_039547 [Glycine max]|nr:hypothetical protein JHK86_039735 [Glycine max]KAG4965336.1 hypothetical protein JHK85_040311 [Glycine max]KAG5110324.1 hypothetical protein JHK82_039547 [Glycine max]KAG5121614.1 hypothetical protein JHK84_039954 [Glycine max]